MQPENPLARLTTRLTLRPKLIGNKMNLTQEYLKEALDYDSETGDFTWRVRPENHFKTLSAMRWTNSRFSGKAAGCVSNIGYIAIKISGKSFGGQRLAWLYSHGILWDGDIDHINGDPLDNRLENLRAGSKSENQQNQKRPHGKTKSGFLGVIAQRNKFVSIITTNRVRIYLGIFNTAIEAHNAYLEAKRKLHPFNTL